MSTNYKEKYTIAKNKYISLKNGGSGQRPQPRDFKPRVPSSPIYCPPKIVYDSDRINDQNCVFLKHDNNYFVKYHIEADFKQMTVGPNNFGTRINDTANATTRMYQDDIEKAKTIVNNKIYNTNKSKFEIAKKRSYDTYEKIPYTSNEFVVNRCNKSNVSTYLNGKNIIEALRHLKQHHNDKYLLGVGYDQFQANIYPDTQRNHYIPCDFQICITGTGKEKENIGNTFKREILEETYLELLNIDDHIYSEQEGNGYITTRVYNLSNFTYRTDNINETIGDDNKEIKINALIIGTKEEFEEKMNGTNMTDNSDGIDRVVLIPIENIILNYRGDVENVRLERERIDKIERNERLEQFDREADFQRYLINEKLKRKKEDTYFDIFFEKLANDYEKSLPNETDAQMRADNYLNKFTQHEQK